MAVVAAEQAARSRATAREVGLARRRGGGDERALVSAQTGGSTAEAGRLIELGEALRDAERAGGDNAAASRTAEDPKPAVVFPVVAAAVNAGRLSAEAASMILRMLRRISDRVEPEALSRAERELVEAARFMRIERLAGLITRTEERLDAAHREELARSRRERRFLRIGETPDGMVFVRGQLDPENGAPLIAVMQAMVTQSFRTRTQMQDARKAGHAVVVDERTPEQVRADAMGDFARHLAGCEVDVLPRSGVTLVLRAEVEDLRTGLAGASVDGLAAGVDAGTLRRMAAAAGILPQVMDGPSVVLDHGRRHRQFTHAQRLALVERDGGCAMCGAPPSWCDAHHIVPWSQGGRSDMDNGVLLCVRCHHDIHRDHWIIDATTTEVWFTPPATVDPERRRRPGGRQLFDSLPPPDDTTTPPAPPAPPGHDTGARCAMTAPEPVAVGPAQLQDLVDPLDAPVPPEPPGSLTVRGPTSVTERERASTATAHRAERYQAARQPGTARRAGDPRDAAVPASSGTQVLAGATARVWARGRCASPVERALSRARTPARAG
ncbi:HNH endonuclease [Demequina activiva]|nr:HNH endonuclease signature motif containing protein [Demequina activiva]